MSSFRLPDLALGGLERRVLEVLWARGPSSPKDVHAELGRSISVNTVSSALKRLCAKQLLRRTKVSHAYVYEASVGREELQRQLLAAIVDEFDDDGSSFLAAFVDLAQERGEDALRALESMVAERLDEVDE